MNDTRKDKRAPVSLKVRFKSATVDEFVEHYSRDISHGGLFIKSKQPMAIGTLLKFELQLKDESKLIQGVGRVVWKRDASDTATDENPAGMGIKFIKMDPESRAIVEKMVEQRGAEPGQYEAGGGDAIKEKEDDVTVGGAAAPSASTSGAARPVRSAKATMAFFPAASLTEADLPPPEDRTQVRQASEFLAAALGGGEDNLASQEAEKKAEEARKRTEEIEKEREAAAAREKAEAEAKERAEKEARERAEREKAERAEKEAKDKADAEKKAEEEKLAAAKAEEDKKAAAAKAEDEKKKAAESKKDEPKKAESKKDEPKKTESKKDEPKKAAVPEARPAEPQSNMLPIFLGVAAVVALGGYYLMSQGSTPEPTPTHETPEPTPERTPEPMPSSEEPEAPSVEAPSVEAPSVEAPSVEAPSVEPGAEAPAAATQSVRVPTTPSGAEIYLGGERLGVAPGPFEVPVGATLDVRLAGHREGHAVVAENIASMPVTLEAFPYVINIVTTPSGATVRVGNQTVTSPARVELPSRPTGPVRIQASLAGFQNSSTTVLVPSFVESNESLVAEAQITLPPVPVAPPRTQRTTTTTTMMDGTAMTETAAEPTMEAAMEATMETAPQTTEAVPENPF